MPKQRYTKTNSGLYRKRIKKSDGSGWHDVYAKTQPELDKKLESIGVARAIGIKFNDKTTVTDITVEWFRLRIENNIAVSTAERMRWMLHNTILPAIGTKKVNAVTAHDIDSMMMALTDKSKDVNRKTLNTTRRIFDYAIENKLIAENPTKNSVAGGTKAKPKKPLTRSQQYTLLAETNGNRIHLFVALCLYTGVRRGEALGLQWDCVHLNDTPYIEVRRKVAFITRTQAELSDTTKTPAGKRNIPLPNQLVELLKAHKKNSKSKFVFATTNGGYLNQVDFNNWWAYISRRSALTDKWVNKHRPIDFRVTPHILRHTYITELIASGMDIKKVQYLAGHTNIQLTLNVYADVVDNRPEDLIGAIKNVWG